MNINLKPHFLKVLIIAILLVVASFNLRLTVVEQQFSFLAMSFLEGSLAFTQMPGTWNDSVLFNSQYYWPLGPFPAVVVLPFVFTFGLLGQIFYQGYLQIILVPIVFYIIYKIAKIYRYTHSDSIILAGAFCFASAFLGVALIPWSWYFSHVITVLLTFVAIYEYLTTKRYWLIGILFGLIFLTRTSASLAVMLFGLLLVFKNSIDSKTRIMKLSQLIIPFGFAVVILGLYNLFRFGNPLEQGYSYQLIPEHAQIARSYGILNPIHIPGNLYYFLLATPLPVFRDGVSSVLQFPFLKSNSWGMSVFITSPYFVYLFLLSHKDKLSKIILFTVVIIALVIFNYYGVGWRQFGYRYSLDFLPLLFWLLMKNYQAKNKQLSNGFKTIVFIAALSNFYLFLTG